MFEVHIGFPVQHRAAASLVIAGPDKWCRQHSNITRKGSQKGGIFDCHAIPGGLSVLLTCKSDSFNQSVDIAQRACECIGKREGVRLELEQVIFHSDSAMGRSVSAPPKRIIDNAIHLGGFVVSKSPPCESHLAVSGCPRILSVEEVQHIAQRFDIKYHEVTQFSETKKIILTAFFSEEEEMLREVTRSKEMLEKHFRRESQSIKVSAKAERIIFTLSLDG